MTKSYVLPLALFAVLTQACSNSVGTFQQGAFVRDSFPYEVAMSRPNGTTEPGWTLENWVLDADGAPTKPKTSKPYSRTVTLDIDGDGNGEEYDLPTYDLHYVHAKTGAQMWTRVVPVEPSEADRDLSAYIDERASDISGRASWLARSIAGDEIVQSKALAADVRNGEETKVAGQPAYAATLDIADIERLRINPGHRLRTLRLIYVRTPYALPTKQVGSTAKAPVLLEVALLTSPSTFDDLVPAFDRFVASIRLGRRP